MLHSLNTNAKKLRRSEWIVACSFFMIMCSLVLISKIYVYQARSLLFNPLPEQRTVSVTVSGAVAKPGSYQVLVGTPVSQVLKRARLKPIADVQTIALNSLIEDASHLYIPEVTEVTVTVRGEVLMPQTITLPAGSRICDLKERISFTQEAEKSYFRRRKRLKNGEIIWVPKKTVE